MIGTEKHVFVWRESFCSMFQFHSEGEVCLSFKGLLKQERKQEQAPGTFTLLMQLMHVSLYTADVLLKDI